MCIRDRYLNEVNPAAQELKDRIRKFQGKEPEKALTGQEVALLNNFIKSLAVIAQASEDAGSELEEVGSRSRGRQRAAKRKRQEFTKKIKQKAGLAGIKMKDFTPQQRQLYDAAKQDFKETEEAKEMAVMDTLAHGDILNLPIVKQLVNTFPPGFKDTLITIATKGDCQGEVTLTCLTQMLYGDAQGI